MKIKDLLERSGVQSLSGGCGEEEITALTYDSRKAQTGSLFFCLRGARSNGEDFAPAAYAQGCRCFVSEGTLDVPEDADVVRVSDARQALAQISAAFFDFPQRDVTIIGVTGTKGKTTVAETACSVMNRMGLACGVIGSSGAAYAREARGDQQHHTGELRADAAVSGHAGRGRPVCGDGGVLSGAGPPPGGRHHLRYGGVHQPLPRDHIGTEEHPDYAHYRDSKKRLFAQCRHGIFNADDPEAAYMMAGSPCEKSTYAIHRPADLRAERVNILKAGDLFGMEFTAAGTTYHIRMPGEYNVYNALAVVALVGRYTDRTCELAEALSYVTVPGRFEVLPDVMPGCTVVLDFAHNSISMNALLQTAAATIRLASSPCSAPAAAPECAATSWGRRWPRGRFGHYYHRRPRIGTTRRRSLRTLPPASAPAAAPMWASWTAGRRCAMRWSSCVPAICCCCAARAGRDTSWCRGRRSPTTKRRRSAPAPVSCWSPAHRPCDRDKEGFLQDKKRRCGIAAPPLFIVPVTLSAWRPTGCTWPDSRPAPPHPCRW